MSRAPASGSRDLFATVRAGDGITHLRPDRASHGEQHAAYEARQARDRERAERAAKDPRLAQREKEREAEQHAAAHRSLDLSRRRIEQTLRLPCPQCAARPGVYCLPRVGGFCAARWQRALGPASLAGATWYQLRDDLEQRSAIAANVNLRRRQDEAGRREAFVQRRREGGRG